MHIHHVAISVAIVKFDDAMHHHHVVVITIIVVASFE
jgi:hypothetical protein